MSWESVDDRIAREYPRVSELAVSELHARLQQSAADKPVLVDVREPEEYRVSRLPEARNLVSAAAIAEQFPDRNTEIVVYCSVGYRSAGVARQLQEMGYQRVQNLRHSIFAWANQGLPLVNDKGATGKVHPFNRAWGSLLDESRRQYRP